MKSTVLEKILNKENIKLNEVIQVIKDNPIFQETMSDVKEQFFIEDSIHGISHNERVVLLACYIGIKEGLNDEELRLVLEASKYHDIGRGFEGNHGQTSATIIERNRDYIFPNLNDEEINIIKALCHGHSVDDKKYEEIARLYEIKDVQNFKRLLDIVKDADALDRVRLPRFGGLDERYLRTEISKEIIDISRELFREYRTIQQNLVIGDSKENRATSNYEFGEGLRRGLLFDGENYYLVRSLNKADIESLDNGNGIIPKIDSMGEHTMQDVMAQIRMQHRKTNLISMSEDPNIVLTYDKSNLHRFVLIKLSKDEIENSRNVFSAGEYLLGVMDYQIENIAKNAPENVRKILERVDNASSIDEVVRIINGADRQVPTSLVETKQQYLSEEEQLEQSKKIAKCKVLNYYGLMRNITHDEKGKLVDISSFTQIMRNGYSSSEWLHSGKIEQKNIVNIPQILVDSLALVKQAEFQGKDKEILRKVEQEILRLAKSGTEINQDNYQLEYSSHENLKSDLTIDKAYEITNGHISYRDTNMQMTAIRSLAEMTLNKRKIIELLQERLPNINIDELLADTYCVNQEMVTRQNNRGSQIGRNISFIISDYGYDFDEELSKQILQNVQNLSNNQLVDIISKGVDAPEITDLLVKTRKNDERIQVSKSKTSKAKYVSEAVVEGYNWKETGNSLTKQEKILVANTLLRGVVTNDEIYKLYEAINKIQIGKNKFTQNEIFAIMINIAIDGKIGDLSYSDLLKKDRNEIQLVLLDNKESIQTSVLPISIDLLAGRGKAINDLKKELINLGLDKDFIDSKDIKNVYVAKQIVDGYDFGREIAEEEKTAILYAILNKAKLQKNATSYLSRIIKNLKNEDFSEQEIYAIIINLGTHGTIVEQEGYDYSRLLASSSKVKEFVKYVDKQNIDVSDMTILKATVNNLNKENGEELRKQLIGMGISPEFIKTKKTQDLYIAKHIIESYDFNRKLEIEEKGAIIQSILKHSAFNKNEQNYLINLLSTIEKLGLPKQEIYGMIINLGINGSVVEQRGYGYSDLLYEPQKVLELSKSNIQKEVKEMTIEKALIDNLNDYEIEKIKQKLIELNIDIEFIEQKDEKNLYMATKIIEGYNFARELNNEEKRAILINILRNDGLNKERSHYLITLANNLEQIGLSRNEIYGVIINLANNSSDRKDTFGYRSFLRQPNIITKEILKNSNIIQTYVSDIDIDAAVCSSVSIQNIEEIKKELVNLGLDVNFIELKDEENLYMAKKIIDGYNFERKLTDLEKKSIYKAVLNNKMLNKDSRYYLTTLAKELEKIGLSRQEVYGTIINLGIHGTATEQTQFDYSRLLMNHERIKDLETIKSDIKFNVSDLSIQIAMMNSLNKRDMEELKQELMNLNFDLDFVESLHEKNIYMANRIVSEYKFTKELNTKERRAIIKLILNNSNLTKKKGVLLSTLVKNLEYIGLSEQEVYGTIINSAVNGSAIERSGFSYDYLLSSSSKVHEIDIHEIDTAVSEITIQEALIKDMSKQDENILIKQLMDLGIEEEFLKGKNIVNVYVAKQIVESYDFGRNINQEEKKNLLKAVLNNSALGGRKGVCYLTSLIKRLEKVGLSNQEIYGMIINLGIGEKILERNGYGYTILLSNKNSACQTIAQYKDEIQTQVTEETIQKAVKKANKPKKIKGQEIAKSTMELTAEGSGGSQVCDDVQTDYQRLMDEKTKENKKEGSEQDVPN